MKSTRSCCGFRRRKEARGEGSVSRRRDEEKTQSERKSTSQGGRRQVFVQTAIRFAIGRRRPGRGDRERGRARAKSAGRYAHGGVLRARDPRAGVTTEPLIATRATEKPARAWKKDTCATFSFRAIGVLETRGRSRQCTHRLVAHLQGLELLGGLDHLDHFERESVGVCVARGVGMEAGARETLFLFPRSESHSTATVREAACRRLWRVTTRAKSAESSRTACRTNVLFEQTLRGRSL